MHIDTRRIKSVCPYFFISHFSVFFASILFLIRQDRLFFTLQKKNCFYQSQLYASTLPRLQFTVKIRVCLSVCLSVCFSVSPSFYLSVSLPLCRSPLLWISVFVSYSFILSFYFSLSSFFSPYLLLFSTSLFVSLYVFSVVTLLISFLLRERALHSVPDLNKQNLRTGI